MSKTISMISILVFLIATTGNLSSKGNDPVEASYRKVASQIIESALNNEGAWQKLVYLCDRIGHRLSGSQNLERAISWAGAEMKRDGLENVRFQPVTVPKWVRGKEWARITGPVERELHMLGLGGSIATPPGGIRGEVVVVDGYDELAALPPGAVDGKILVYNTVFEGYGKTARYRYSGAIEAARRGAIAALLRSVTPFSIQSPHTGSTSYSDKVQKIPFAAITIEDTELLDRLSQSEESVEVELYMEARTHPDSDSANVIGELVGRETPQEVVVIGGHIDSWDVGQGAHDDGAGVAVSMEVLKVLRDLGLRPRRTLRVVLWTNEENGLRGAKAYGEAAAKSTEKHVAAIEMDAGAEDPIGFGLGLRNTLKDQETLDKALETVREIGRLLEPIETDQIRLGGGGADISPLMNNGVPGLGLRTVGREYFIFHHTEADTVDKIDPQHLRKALASMAVMAYVLADMPQTLLP